MGMALQETTDTFSYLIQELNRLNVLYITLVRYVESQDPNMGPAGLPHGPCFLQHVYIPCIGARRGTPHDVLATYRQYIKHPYLFLNAGIGIKEANGLLEKRSVDAIVFGRLWISHPDLQMRIERGLPAENPIDWSTVNGRPDLDPRRGYTDYPLEIVE